MGEGLSRLGGFGAGEGECRCQNVCTEDVVVPSRKYNSVGDAREMSPE